MEIRLQINMAEYLVIINKGVNTQLLVKNQQEHTIKDIGLVSTRELIAALNTLKIVRD